MIKTINPSDLTYPQLYRLLMGVVVPRPIALASTMDARGKANLAPFSCFNVFGANPPTLVFSPSRGGRQNHLKDTYLNIKEVPEVVINMVSYSMVEQMNLSGTEYPREVNEFIKAGFTPLASEVVKPFRVKESPVQMECSVQQVIETGTGPGAANLVICRVLMLHVNKDVMDENGWVDPRKLDIIGRLGNDNYVRINTKNIFEIARPTTNHSIGIDSLPENVRMSSVLTGNDLGKLGTLPSLPLAPEVEKYRKGEMFRNISTAQGGNEEKIRLAIHLIAHNLIAENELNEAILLLLAAEV